MVICPDIYSMCSIRSALEKSFLQVMNVLFGADAGHIPCILPYTLLQAQLSSGCDLRNEVLPHLLNESCKVTLPLFA